MMKLQINRSIFSDETVKTAMDVYCDYAVITANFSDNYALLTFGSCQYDEALTVKEFENYMIGIENG